MWCLFLMLLTFVNIFTEEITFTILPRFCYYFTISYPYEFVSGTPSGIQAVDMAITRTGLWAVNTQGEIFFRYGIALDNPTGDYWKKIPGTLAKITGNLSLACNIEYHV